MAVPGSPSLIVRMFSVDVKQHQKKEESRSVDLIKSDTDLLTKLVVTAVDSVRTVATELPSFSWKVRC